MKKPGRWLLGVLGITISFLSMRSRIYERERAESALEKLRRQQEQILLATGEGIYGVNSRGKMTFVNPAAVKLLGWTPDEMIGNSLHKAIHHTKPDGTLYDPSAVDTCTKLFTDKGFQFD